MPRPHGRQATSWWGSNVPASTNIGTANTWVGIECGFHVPGRVFGLRAYRLSGNDNAPYGLFWDRSNFELLGAKAFKDVVFGTGWQQAWFHPTIRVDTSTTYQFACMFASGHYSRTNNGLIVPVTRNGIEYTKSFLATSLSVPWLSSGTNANAHGVDVLFQAD